MLLMELIGIFIVVLIIVYTYYKYVLFNFWRKRGVFYVEPIVPTGNIGALVTRKVSIGKYLLLYNDSSLFHFFEVRKAEITKRIFLIGGFFHDIYVKYKEHRAFGIYTFFKPNLVIADPDLIREVLTKEFKNFHDRGMFCNDKVDPLSGHLFLLPGKKWRNLRVKLTPTFTSGKIKKMFVNLKMCGEEFVKSLESIAQTGDSIEIKDWFVR